MHRNKGFTIKHIEGQGGGGCFAENTLVLMADGNTKPIQDVAVGEFVMAWSLPNGELEPKEVLETFKHDVVLETFDKWLVLIHGTGREKLFCTETHHLLTEQGTWQEAKDFEVDDFVMLADGSRSKILLVVHEDSIDWTSIKNNFMDLFDADWSYNLLVADLHTYVANDIRVSNGGGGSKGQPEQNTPQEAPNTLQSKQLVRILDMLGEGEIEGLSYPPGHPSAGQTISTAADIAQGIFIDDSPLQDANGNTNFGGININFKEGLPYPTQTVIPGFPSTENTVGVSTTVTKAIPVIREGIDDEVDGIRVIITWGSLSKLDVSTGDLKGATVTLAIDSRKNALGGWNERNKDVVSGKTISPYQREYRIDKPSDVGPGDTWGIRVRRISDDAVKANTQDAFQWSAYVEVTDARFSYPDTALVGLNLDAQLLGNRIPVRSYEVKGLKIKIPVNYNPTTRNYAGIWDGTFTVAYSNNPAWVLYDLLTNDRYGMGQHINAAQIDKFKFFEVGQYCDGVDSSGNFVGVDDGFGGTEPRFTFNGVIQTREEALKIVNAISTAFRGMSYWSSGAVTVTQDSPSDPVKLLGPGNVLGGLFNYSSTAINARNTRAKVTWNDPGDDYRPRIEFVDDAIAIDKFGLQQREVAAIGATSRGQAHRLGRWILDSERFEGMTVQFGCSFDNADLFPGAVIEIMDPNFSGFDFLGRCQTGSTTTNIKLDRTVTLALPGPYTIEFMRIDSFTDTDTGWTSTTANNRFTNATQSPAFNTVLKVGEEVEITGFNDMGVLAGTMQAVNATSRFTFSVDNPSTVFTVGQTIEVFDMGANNGVHVITALGATFIEVLASALTNFGPTAVGIKGPRQAVVNGFHKVNAVTATTFDVATTLPTDSSNTATTINGELGVIETAQTVSGAFPQTANNFTVTTAFSVAPTANAIWMIKGPAAGQTPTKWRVISNVEEEKNIFQITCVKHDPAKYGRVEGGVVVEPDNVTRFSEKAIDPVCITTNDTVQAVAASSKFIFSTVNPLTLGFLVGDSIDVAGFVDIANNSGVFTIAAVDATSITVSETLINEGPVSNVWIRERLTITLETQTDPFGVRPRMRVSFGEPPNGQVRTYRMRYTFNNGPPIDVQFNGRPETFIENPQAGRYKISVVAINIVGFESIPCDTIVDFSSADLFNIDQITGLKIDDVLVTVDPQEWFGLSPIITWDRLSEMGNFTGDIVTTLSSANWTINAGADQYIRSDGNSWLVEGYEVGDIISVEGTDNAANSGNTTVQAVTATVLTVTSNLVAETPARTITFEQLTGVESGQFDGFFRDYKIEVETTAGSNVLTAYTKEPKFRFSLPLNTTVFGGSQLRDFKFKISARDKLNRQSIIVVNDFTNPNPATPTSVAVSAISPKSYSLVYDECTEQDCEGFALVFHSKTSGFVPSITRETKSFGKVELTAGAVGDTVQIDVAGIDVSGIYTYTNSNLATQALGLMRAIQAKKSNPQYTAQPSTASPNAVDIFSVDTYGATPNGSVVATTKTGTAAATDTNFAGGVNAVLVAGGFFPSGVTIDTQVEKDVSYFTRVAFVDSFYTFAQGVTGLNISPEIETRSILTDVDLGTAPAIVTGVGATTDSIIQPDGTIQKDIVVSWTNVPAAEWYDIEIIASGDTTRYQVGASSTSFTLKAATQGILHTIRVRGANVAGAGPFSAPAVTITPSGDTTAPGLPTNLAANATFKGVFVSARPPADVDVARIEVWHSLTNNRSATGTHVGNIFVSQDAPTVGTQDPQFYHSQGTTAGPVTHYYWFRTIDRSGNASAFTPGNTAGTSATTIEAATADYANLSITNAKIGLLAVDTAQIADLAVETTKINNAAITNAKIGNLAVDTAQITDAAITTAKIDNLAVQTANIADLNVTTLKIAGLNVTTPKIADDAVRQGSASYSTTATAIGTGPSWTILNSTSLTNVDGLPLAFAISWAFSFAVNLIGTNQLKIETQMRVRNTTDSIDVFTLNWTNLFFDVVGGAFNWEIGGVMESSTAAVSSIAGKNYTLYLETRKTVTGTGTSSWTTANSGSQYVELVESKK